MILRDALKHFEAELEQAGVSSPSTNAEWIASAALGMGRMEVLLRAAGGVLTLTPEQIEVIKRLIRRRAAREPLQYILESASFCGIEVKVAPGVLVPRPETELLAETGWKFLKTRTRPTALDYCSGSGCIALSLAVYAREARIWGVEISVDALRIAWANAKRYDLDGRIRIMEGDSLQAAREGAPFDLIISNPPYIPSAEIDTLEPEVSRHEPRMALDGGPDGLHFYRMLAKESPEFLKDDGELMAEFGDGQFKGIEKIFRSAGWKNIRAEKDYSDKERFFVAKFH